jgi:hypothetical protein
MDKIIELLLYTTFVFAILTRFRLIFNNHHIALLLSLFLYNLLFELFMGIYDKTAIKLNLILHSTSQALTSVAIFVAIYELLTQVPEMSETIRMFLISIVIGLITKGINKFYNFSRI